MDTQDGDYRHFELDPKADLPNIEDRWKKWHTQHHLQVAFNRRNA